MELIDMSVFPNLAPVRCCCPPPEALPDVVADYIADNDATISGVLIFGGPAALAPAVEDEINQILGIASE